MPPSSYRSLILRPLFLLIVFLLVMYFWRTYSSEPDPGPVPVDHRGTEKLFVAEKGPFYHGVASGDPMQDRVIIWTRVTPQEHAAQEVTWEISTEPALTPVVQTGVVSTDSLKDYTVKVDVSGLRPGTDYYYRFHSGDKYSVTGRTRTAPGGNKAVRFAVVSCNNYEAGYFNVFARIAERDDLHAVIHLGDYIYELATGLYGDSSLKDRLHLPPGELLTLSDYRTRYSQYRLDPDLQQAHQQHPFIAIWDDHEITNNAYATGGQNHQPEEGDYLIRRAAAQKAYYEWLPVRESPGGKLYRSFHFSGAAELIMLDERLEGRAEQVQGPGDPRINTAEQTMLGPEQLQWLLDKLARSQATWKIIGNQVIFSSVDKSPLNPSQPYNMDAWDGYPEERRRLLDFIRKGGIRDVVFVTGDTHSSWAFEVPDPAVKGPATRLTDILAVEFGTPSISSANSDEYLPAGRVREIEGQLMDPGINPHLKYVNLRDHGYLELALDTETARAIWHYTTALNKRDAGIFEAANWRCLTIEDRLLRDQQ